MLRKFALGAGRLSITTIYRIRQAPGLQVHIGLAEMPGPDAPDNHDRKIYPRYLADRETGHHQTLEYPTGSDITAAIHNGINEVLALVLGFTFFQVSNAFNADSIACSACSILA